MTSDYELPSSFTEIDNLIVGDHHWIELEDNCRYFGEYVPGAGYDPPFNNHILNFKKSPERRGRPEWPHKRKAIVAMARMMRSGLGDHPPDGVAFVPVPPSRARSDELYDDRLVQMLGRVWPRQEADVRELVVLKQSIPAAHSSEDRPSPEDLLAVYEVDESLAEPEPEKIVIVDDVLTTGAHFTAVKRVLLGCFPGASISGLFIARTVRPSMEITTDLSPEFLEKLRKMAERQSPFRK